MGLAAVFSDTRVMFATLFDDATSALTNKPNGESGAVAKTTPPLYLDNEAARVHHIGGRCNEDLGSTPVPALLISCGSTECSGQEQ